MRQRQQGEFDLTKISMAPWAEGLRRPAMHDFAYDFYAKMNEVFTTLTDAGSALGCCRRAPTPRRWLTSS